MGNEATTADGYPKRRSLTRDDLGYRIVAWIDGPEDLHVQVEARYIYGDPPDELMLSGSIKWDGCANVFLGDCAKGDHHVLSHFCERARIENFGKALPLCYDLAKELLGDKIMDEQTFDGGGS